MDISLLAVSILILQALSGAYGIYLAIGCIRGYLKERGISRKY